jgi:cation diffusion facilitator family transporter
VSAPPGAHRSVSEQVAPLSSRIARRGGADLLDPRARSASMADDAPPRPGESGSQGDRAADRRLARVRRVLWGTLGLNLLVAAMKIAAGTYSGSTALLADGFHSVFDGVSNVVGLFAVGVAAQPPDQDHPYGHHKIEVAASLVIGVMVLLAMIEIGRQALAAFGAGEVPRVDVWALGAASLSLVISAVISRWEGRVGDELDSPILLADAGHTASDALATTSVLAGLGLVWIGVPAGDLIATVVVLFFVGVAVWRIFERVVEVLVDVSRIDPEEVRAIADEIAGIISCHEIRSRGMSGHIQLDLHVTFAPETTLSEAGDRMLLLKERLHERFPRVQDIVVQLEPHLPEHLPADELLEP